MFEQNMKEMIREEVRKQNKSFVRLLAAAIRSVTDESEDGSSSSAKKGKGKPGRPPGRQMTPEGRKKIAEAQKARWAARRESSSDSESESAAD